MTKSVQKMLSRMAKGLGYELTARWRLPEKPLAELLAAVFQRHAIELVCDVGANRGQFVAFLRQQVGYQGRIISFEPISANVAHLQTLAARDTGWTVVGCALGRTEGMAELNVMAADVFSSFLAPSSAHDATFVKMNTVVRTETVKVRTLDAVLAELGIETRDISTAVKLDTQGFDLEVVAGAPLTMQQARCVQSEVSVVALYAGMPDMASSFATFNDLGLNLAGLFVVSRDASLAAIEFDAVFVRPSSTPNAVRS